MPELLARPEPLGKPSGVEPADVEPVDVEAARIVAAALRAPRLHGDAAPVLLHGRTNLDMEPRTLPAALAPICTYGSEGLG